MTYSVAIIGTGADPTSKGREGYAMAYRHAPGYLRLDSCDLIACADIVPDRAAKFADHYDLDHWFSSTHELIEEIDPDIISVCVPPAAHADVVTDCAEHGDPMAIHCEKPMATTWGECKRMLSACDSNGIQLTIDHQRRLAAPVREAKRLIDHGEIGTLRRLEWSEVNLFDAGSHLFDLCDHFTDGARPEWALANVAADPDNRWFGAVNDSHAIATWGYSNGVVGLASTAEGEYPTAVDPYVRIVGSEGTIEIQTTDGIPLRIDTGNGWQPIDTNGETVYGPTQSKARAAANKVLETIPAMKPIGNGQPTHYERAIEHLVSCLDAGQTPVFDASRVIRGTELIFACYESANSHNRVELPLDIEGNPLESLIERQSVVHQQ